MPQIFQFIKRFEKYTKNTDLFIAFGLLAIVGLWHQATTGWAADKTLLIISFVFAGAHLFIFGSAMAKGRKG